MRLFSTSILSLASLVFLYSCGSSKKARNSFVPFNKDLRAKLEKDNIDLRQVQFYVDQKLILSRNMGDQKTEVHEGIVKLENGKYINEVIVPAFTPGVCDTIINDRLMIRFRKREQ